MTSRWLMPLPTDYFDSKPDNCILKYSQEISRSYDKKGIYSVINSRITDLMDILYRDAEKFQLTACCIIDDLYHSAYTSDVFNTAYFDYLENVAAPFFRYLKTKGLTIHYSTDNHFVNHYLPVEILPVIMEKCGIRYICPYHIAKQLMESEHKPLKNYLQLLPEYIEEAKEEAKDYIRTANASGEHYFYLFPDGDDCDFAEMYRYAGHDGILSLFRDKFPDESTELTFISCSSFKKSVKQ